jgi:hypothetical protein
MLPSRPHERTPVPDFDRRIDRLQPPACPTCHGADTQVATRTEYVLYLRCPRCAHVWSIGKPGSSLEP